MGIKFKEVKPAPNWLVLQPTGNILSALRETSAGFVIDTTWEREKNAVVTAWVKKVCDRLEYVSPTFMDNSSLDQRNGEAPLEFDADIEIQEGDLVYFNYLSIQKAIDFGRVIVDEEGQVYCLIRYDRLYAAAREHKCMHCDGFGYTSEHDPMSMDYQTGEHDCSNCPIQVQCEHCLAIGKTTQWIPLNGYVLAERLRVEPESAFITLDTEALNEVLVHSASYIREDFWDKLQTPAPYRYHQFLQAGDIAVIREQAGKKLDGGVLAFNEEVNFVRFQESTVFARLREGVITPNTGIVLIEPQDIPMFGLAGTERYNPMNKGVIISSWDESMNGQEVLYKKANERKVLISGINHTFVTDCSCVIPFKGQKILC